jgi:anti-anti-sigma factor
MRTTLPATLQSIEGFFEEFRRRSLSVLSERACFAAELLVREALTNAVVHGCGADPGRQIRCALRLRGSRLFISVADDGEGFDWRGMRSNRAALPDTSGRGMEILHQYADHVRFNNKGNVVTMIQTDRQRKVMTVVTREDNKAVVRPAGDTIVAATIPELRLKMRAIVEEGVRELVIDLAGVRMVDSSGLGLLIAAHNSLRKLGGQLAVIHVSSDLMELFRSMRMHQHFSVTGG